MDTHVPGQVLLMADREGGTYHAALMSVDDKGLMELELANGHTKYSASVNAIGIDHGKTKMRCKSLFKKPIETYKQAAQFIEALVAADMHFHLEDDTSKIININTNERVFTDEEANDVDRRLQELYSLDWSKHDCPIGYMLKLMENME